MCQKNYRLWKHVFTGSDEPDTTYIYICVAGAQDGLTRCKNDPTPLSEIPSWISRGSELDSCRRDPLKGKASSLIGPAKLAEPIRSHASSLLGARLQESIRGKVNSDPFRTTCWAHLEPLVFRWRKQGKPCPIPPIFLIPIVAFSFKTLWKPKFYVNTYILTHLFYTFDIYRIISENTQNLSIKEYIYLIFRINIQYLQSF